ncbi:MAG: UbiA family prenyltransferase, partial [Pseudomonadota bacterium]
MAKDTADKAPVLLDVDGTLLRTDLLWEAIWAGLGSAPLATIAALFKNIGNIAALKAEIAAIVTLRYDLMPVREEVLQLALDAEADGRAVGLASASEKRWVEGIAEASGLSGPIHASEGGTNLKGPAKARALEAAYGKGGYIYAGDAPADRPVWESAQAAIVVGNRPAARKLEAQGTPVIEIAGSWAWGDLFRALRPHQWVKNILLLLPLIAAHDFALASFGLVALGIVAFSAAASAIYIVNDLLDLEADRLHATKRHRPFASGAVPITVGMGASAGLIVLALALAMLLSPWFLGAVVLYMALSLAYSLRLKRMRWVDIVTLASLYTLRVVAGAAATQVEASAMMLIFIFPVFLSLGCVKRLTELTLATSDAPLPGRGYGRADRGDLLNVASIGVVGALLVFFLYSLSDQAAALYPTRWILWLALIPIGIWL